MTKIQEYRKERKVTQNELADAVNVTRQTIISLENGKYKASLVLAHKIAQFFKVSMKHNTGVSNIEITDQNIRAFSSTAKKYGLDFALKKDTSGEHTR